MTSASPCVGICKLDDATGYCVGCARTGDEIADWRSQTPSYRAAVWDALPARFQTLGVTCRRLPWHVDDIRAFVLRSLRDGSGTWVVGVVGAVAEFTDAPGADTDVIEDGARVEAFNPAAYLRFQVDEHVRAVTFDPPETPSDRQRVVLAVKRARGGPPVADALTDLGPDEGAARPADRKKHLFDFGLGREEARFAVRCGPGAAREVLASATGRRLDDALSVIGPSLLRESPTRVVESALGRIEIAAPIPAPGGRSPIGPHTHLLPDHLAAGLAAPAGMELPPAYLQGATFYPQT